MSTGPITHTTGLTGLTGITRTSGPNSTSPSTGRRSSLVPSPKAPFQLGRYMIMSRLGSGGMGVVYEALDIEKSHKVAIKTGRRMDPAGLIQLKNEFRAVSDIVHPNLVTLYELVADGEEWFFTMELIDGVSFLEYVRKDGMKAAKTTASALSSVRRPVAGALLTRATADHADELEEPSVAAPGPWVGLGEESLLRLRDALDQLAAGVIALHSAGKLHRDLKPGNVMVTRDGRLVLLDFGIAIGLLEENADGPRPEHILGTAAYMAPEQGAALPLSEAADWYSVGVMLFEVLTGQLPFTGPPTKILIDKQSIAPPAPRMLVDGIPEDLDRLCVDLLRVRPDDRPTGADVRSRLRGNSDPPTRRRASPAPLAPFIGRGEQLLALEDAYRATTRGEAVSVFVHGRSGMGKSALVHMFLESLRHREQAVVLTGRCYERESVPYKAFDSLIDSLTQHLGSLPAEESLELLPDEIHELARVFPVLEGIGAVAQAPRCAFDVRDPQELRRRAFRGLKILLGRIAASQPLVLFIDDIHWGDPDSAHLLDELLSPPDRPAVLLLSTYRSEDVDTSPLLRELFRGPSAQARNAREVAVGPLSPDDGRRLALSLMREPDDAVERAEAIADESSGSPLFIEQLVRHNEAGTLDDSGGAPNDPRCRISIEDLVVGQLAQLPPAARNLLEVIAVAGRPLEQGVALAASLGGAEMRSALAVLRSGNLIRTRGVRNRDTVESYHDRIRVVVVSRLDAEQVRRHHRALATTLEATPAPDPEVLALHFHGAGELRKTVEYAARAGDYAASTLAFDRAAELYRLALDCADPARREAGDPAGRDRVGEAARIQALQTKRADALVNAGRCAEAAPLYLAAAAAAHGPSALELRRRAAEQLLVSGHIERGVEILGPVLREVSLSYPVSSRRALVSFIARIAQLEIRGTEFRERSADQISPRELTRVDVCWSAGKGLIATDSIRGGSFLVRSLLLSLAVGEPTRVARGLAVYGMMAVYEGSPSGFKKGTKILDESARIAQPLADPYLTANIGICSGIASMSVGRFREGLKRIDGGVRILQNQCAGVAWECSVGKSSALNSLFWLGEIGEIARRAPAWLRDAEQVGDVYAMVTAEQYDALARLAADDIVGARERLRRALGRWCQTGFHFQHWLSLKIEVLCDLYEGKPSAAWARLQSAWKTLEDSHLMRVQLMLIDALMLRATTAAAVAGRGEDRRRMLDSADRDAAALKRVKRQNASACADFIRGLTAAAWGDRDAATERLADAAAGFDAAEIGLQAACARRLRGVLLGGERGQALLRQADTFMMEQGIKRPELWTSIHAPSLPLAASR